MSIALTTQQLQSETVEVSIAALLALPQLHEMVVDAIEASLRPAILASGSIEIVRHGRQRVTFKGATVRTHTIQLADGTDIDIMPVRGGRVLLHDPCNDYIYEVDEA